MEAPVFTALIKQLKQQKLFYAWTRHLAYGETAVQVCTGLIFQMCVFSNVSGQHLH